MDGHSTQSKPDPFLQTALFRLSVILSVAAIVLAIIYQVADVTYQIHAGMAAFLAYACFAYFMSRHPSHFEFILNLFLGVSVLFVCWIAWMDVPSRSSIVLFFGLIVLVASYLGTRKLMIYWAFVSGIALVLLFFAQAILTDSADDLEFRFRALDGTVTFLLTAVLASVLQASRERTEAITSKQYTSLVETKRAADKLAEELQRKNVELQKAIDSKSAFLANMSHEIRTPMNAVLGMTNLLLETGLTSEQQELARTVEYSGYSLLRILNDILDLSKLQANMLKVSPAPIQIRPNVSRLKRMFDANALESGVNLQAKVEDDVPDWVISDGVRVSQVMGNLIANAIKFSPKGEVVIHISQAEREHYLRCEIRDNGPGISAAERERLFKPFEQLDNSFTRRAGGTGLGLAISKQIITLMGGEIGVNSEVGKGSTFWFEICCVPTSQPRRSSKNPHAEALITGLRVLVAEDNAVNQRITRRFLNRMGIEPEMVTNGIEAVRAVNERDFDVVLMDCHMPEMDGYEATREIRKSSQHDDLRIVAVTASALEADVALCRESGMNAHLAKPFTERALGRILVGGDEYKGKL